jgi:hypothetical protein
MSVPLSIMLGVATIILVSGLINALQIHLKTKRDHQSASVDENVSVRLDEVEARLRDVLDVMIAVSEKMDRWENEGGPHVGTPRSAGR